MTHTKLKTADSSVHVGTTTYDKLAQDYDQVRFQGPNGLFLARTDSAIVRDLIKMAGAKRIVDAPMGTGRVAEYLHLDRVEVIGCDLSRSMMDRARSHHLRTMAGRIQCDTSSLPFRDNSVECITCLRFFHLFPRQERQRFVLEFERIVRSSGHLIISFTNGWYAGGVNWLRRAAGQRTVYFQHYGEMNTLFKSWEILAVRGNFLPFQYHLSKLGRRAEALGLYFTSRWPLNRICWERYYLLRKTK